VSCLKLCVLQFPLRTTKPYLFNKLALALTTHGYASASASHSGSIYMNPIHALLLLMLLISKTNFKGFLYLSISGETEGSR